MLSWSKSGPKNISGMNVDGEKTQEVAIENGPQKNRSLSARRAVPGTFRPKGKADSAGEAGSKGGTGAVAAVWSERMTNEELQLEIDDLNFHVDKSLRYHQRRRGFYDSMHRWLMFGVILFGGIAAVYMPEVFGTLASVCAAVNLVLNVSHRARDHEMLFRQFSDLAIEVRTRKHEATESGLAGWTKCRLSIESGEPPIYHALEADCDNQVRRAWGRDEKLVQIDGWAKLTMNWMRHRPAMFATEA